MMDCTATLSVAFIETCRLLPVQVPLGGLVMAAVGEIESVVTVVVSDVVPVLVPLVAVVVVPARLVVGAPDAYVGVVALL